MYYSEDFLKKTNSRFKFLFINIILIIILGTLLFCLVFFFAESKVSSIDKIENNMEQIKSGIQTDKRDINILIDKTDKIIDELRIISKNNKGNKNGQ